MAVWPWGALYLLRASLSSLQSLGVTTCPMEQHEKKRISAGQGSQGACWPRGGGGQWSRPALPSITPPTGFQALGRTTLAGIPHPGLGPRV